MSSIERLSSTSCVLGLSTNSNELKNENAVVGIGEGRCELHSCVK
jgi:hypothetical protein